MTAVDESGTRLARFRRSKKGLRDKSGTRTAHRVEVVVNPSVKLSTEIVLILALSSGFTVSWYAGQGGGGGG
jgi:hypothetical protein